MDEATIDEAVKMLEEYSRYEGTEVGHKWSSLSELWNSCRGYLSVDFEMALNKEILAEAKVISTDYKFRRYKQTYTREIVDLEYIG